MKINKKRIIRLGWPFLVLFVLAIIIMRERIGLKLEENDIDISGRYQNMLYELSGDSFSPPVESPVECLVIANSKEEQSRVFMEDMEFILESMKVGFDVCDAADTELPSFQGYSRIVLTMENLDILGEKVIELCNWVEQGGQLMNTGTFNMDGYFSILGTKAGILNINDLSYNETKGIHLCDDFMINAGERDYYFDEPMLTSLNIALTNDCRILLEDVDSGQAVMWERDFGKGRFVIFNQVLTGKVNRGFLSSAYALLGDCTVYPVINASAYYLDDFPSPVPNGNGEYITRDYGVSIVNFYSNIWWPDIMELEEEFGIMHTGLIIEEYSEQVKGPFDRNTFTERFFFFGNMLLNQGGELGFHGYNHMPLCLDSYDYGELEHIYKKWPSMEDMKNSLRELKEFSSDLFREETFSVYVPPSNIMSEEGKQAIIETLPDIRVIASIYFEDTGAYTQEFGVSYDGIIETPRITSGCEFGEYMMLSAFSELNFHYVQSHFLHPYDVLDEDRGASMGWEKMYGNLKDYISYVKEAAPGIREMTGSGMAEAVREYDSLSVKRTYGENKLTLDLGGFYEEAYLCVMFNEGEPSRVTGGSVEHLSGERYLLHAQEEQVILEWKEKAE